MPSLRPSAAPSTNPADSHRTSPAPLGTGLAAAVVDVHGVILQARDCEALYRELCACSCRAAFAARRCASPILKTEELVTVASAGEPTPIERVMPRRSARTPPRVRRLRSVPPPAAAAGFPLLCGGHPVALLQVAAHAAEELSAIALDLLDKLSRNLSLALDGLEHQRHKRAAEQALLHNAIRFRDAAGAAGEYVWEVDLEGHFTYLSEGIEALCGYRPEELVGRKPIDLMPEGDRHGCASG